MEDSDGDEYFLAPEDEEGALQRLAAVKAQAAAAAAAPPREPAGVRAVHPTLTLLHSGAPLRIPVTQEEGSTALRGFPVWAVLAVCC